MKDQEEPKEAQNATNNDNEYCQGKSEKETQVQMMDLVAEGMVVAEIYGPLGVAERARE